MSSKNDPNSVKSLFTQAAADGILSPQSASVLQVRDLGAQIQAGLGISVDDVQASEVVLLAELDDDSGSIRFGNNAQLLRDGHNQMLEALRASKQSSGILAFARYLNGTILYPFMPVDQALLMDASNFDPMGGTPLYDEMAVILGTILAKEQQFSGNGVPCRGITVIVTDGADSGSHKMTAAKIRPIVEDLLRTERHIVAAIGIDDGYTDFKAIFNEMGIEDKWILTPKNTPSDIRKAFAMMSQSAVRASQSARGFSQTAAGGFGNP